MICIVKRKTLRTALSSTLTKTRKYNFEEEHEKQEADLKKYKTIEIRLYQDRYFLVKKVTFSLKKINPIITHHSYVET